MIPQTHQNVCKFMIIKRAINSIDRHHQQVRRYLRRQGQYLLCGLLLIGGLSGCRIGFFGIDDNNNDDPSFNSILVVRDSFDQIANTFNTGEDIQLEIVLVNTSEESYLLEFDTEQQFDFFVTDPNFTPVWNWSQGQTFEPRLTSIRLEPQQRIQLRATWNQLDNNGQAVPTGTYPVQGIVTVLGEGLNQHLSQQESEFRTEISEIIIQ